MAGRGSFTVAAAEVQLIILSRLDPVYRIDNAGEHHFFPRLIAPGDVDGRLDRFTGEVWPAADIDYALDVGDEVIDVDDPDRWLVIVPEGSRAGYDDMTDFIATLSDTTLIDRLERAIDGRGAFRRFRDTLATAPSEFTRWRRFAADRQRGRARGWLADRGYQPHHTPTRTAPA